jgi:hypothetical protein
MNRLMNKMEQVNAKNPQDREKSEFVYGNEKMNAEHNEDIEQQKLQG